MALADTSAAALRGPKLRDGPRGGFCQKPMPATSDDIVGEIELPETTRIPRAECLKTKSSSSLAHKSELHDSMDSDYSGAGFEALHAPTARASALFHEVSDVVSDVWTAGAMNVKLALRAFKGITQSVVEVMCIDSIEVSMPKELMPNQTCFARLRLQTCSAGGFTKQRSKVYGTCDVHLNSDNCTLTQSNINQVCRVMRQTRKRGLVVLDIALMYGGGQTTFRSRTGKKEKPVLLMKYRIPLPAYMDDKASLTLQTSGVDYLSRHPSKKLQRLKDSNVVVKLRAAASAEVFDIAHCEPIVHKLMALNEWKPKSAWQWSQIWKSPWNESDLVNWTGLLQTMTKEMKQNAIILYQTLFAQSFKNAPPRPALSEAEEEAHDRRVLFLKRLILFLATCRLTFSPNENGTFLKPWPFPLAAALAHGCRILVRLDGVSWQEFLNSLLFGDPETHTWSGEDAVPSPFWSRWAATHAVSRESEGQLYERKLKARSVVKNVTDGLLGHHLGMGLPLGGLGNRAPVMANRRNEPLFIGPNGVPFKKLRHNLDEHPSYVEEIQHGHLYLRWDDFGVTSVPVLVSDTGFNHGRSSRSFRKGGSRPRLNRQSTNLSRATLTSTHFTARTLFAPRSYEDDDPQDDASEGCTSAVESAQMAADLMETSSRATTPSRENEWTTLNHVRSLASLQAVLNGHGYTDLEEGTIRWIHRILVEDSELALQTSEAGLLRLRGVLIHLVFEQRAEQRDQDDRILVHLAAETAYGASRGDEEDDSWTLSNLRGGLSELKQRLGEAVTTERVLPSMLHTYNVSPTSSTHMVGTREDTEDSSNPGVVRVEDSRIVMFVRRRNESWKDAIRRLCFSQLQLNEKATENIIQSCSRSMTGSADGLEPESSLYIYDCSGRSTICHHHSIPDESETGIPIEYQAYRFTFAIPKKERHLFQKICQNEFQTTEHSQQLRNFAHEMPEMLGTITRSWVWLTRNEAIEKGVAGVELPDERLHIQYDTNSLCSVLLGIEGSAPHKETFFGDKHNAQAKSKDLSAFGSRKWRDYRRAGQEVPADIGGMRVQVDREAFEQFVSLCRKTCLSRPSEGYSGSANCRFEKKLFRSLLTASDEQAERVLREESSFGRKSIHVHSGTMILEAKVRERSTPPVPMGRLSRMKTGLTTISSNTRFGRRFSSIALGS